MSLLSQFTTISAVYFYIFIGVIVIGYYIIKEIFKR
jgi:hypothetical protein